MLVHPSYFVAPGSRVPLGATFDGFGTNFAIFSEVAEAIDLCLFDQDGAETKIPMTEVDGYVVRHEALLYRMEVGDLHWLAVVAAK